MSISSNERHYLTLPFGAFTDLGTVNQSPFFGNRHTYQLSTPGNVGELYWLLVNNFNGLLYPRLTTEETILREFGVFQEGGTTVLIKPPVRNFSVDIDIIGNDRISYSEARLLLAYIISWTHTTASPPPQFETINEIYNISTVWGRPNPFTYTIVRPNDVAYHIDCFPQTVDPQPDTGNPDAEMLSTSLRLTADNPSIYGNEISVLLEGKIGQGETAEPEDAPFMLLSPFATPEGINYSKGTFASARTGFVFDIELPPSVNLPTTLYSFGLYEVNTGKFARFKHFDYPFGGWTLPSGYNRLSFDSVNKTFIASNQFGGAFSLDRISSPKSNWDNFLLSPGKIYKPFLEINVGISSVLVNATMTYRPRWAGI